MGKPRVIAETGAGQHGVATATACARFGFDCVVYMGEEDIRRQKPNVFSMKLLGAEVRPVSSGSRTLRDAVNEAMRDWMASVETTHYILGSVVGPNPFPKIVRDFQSVIGRETRRQCLEQIGRLPHTIVACCGGGSNAAGMFYPFIEDTDVRLVGVEAGGRSEKLGDHAAPLNFGRPGVLHGAFSYVMQDDDGQTADVHSVSAGLDYPGVGPEHSYWKDSGRAQYTYANDRETLNAFDALAKTEGNPGRPGKLPRRGQGHRDRVGNAARRNPRRLPLRPRRQGCRGDCTVARGRVLEPIPRPLAIATILRPWETFAVVLG